MMMMIKKAPFALDRLVFEFRIIVFFFVVLKKAVLSLPPPNTHQVPFVLLCLFPCSALSL